jgi:hypothetical protein
MKLSLPHLYEVEMKLLLKLKSKYIRTKGGDYMIKKAAIATGVFAVSAMAAATMTFAQTATPAANNTTNNTTTVTPTTSATMPSAAPATGR